MRLIIGGCAQGKLDYALEYYGGQAYRVWDGEVPQKSDIPQNSDITEETVVVNHLHRWVRERMEAGGDPQREIRSLLDRYPDCVIICDEIGNGIVPVEAFERAYREQTGRISRMLAKEAEEVVRVICGIGQRIK